MLCVEFDTAQPDILIAMLSQYAFDGFQEYEDSLLGYISEETWTNIEKEVLGVIAEVAIIRDVRKVPEVNWNAEWEKSFKPVIIDDFSAIRASFHAPIRNCRHEIVIDPRMAFGTGHHETTELMIRQMQNLSFTGKTVLDLGCGTGILAILAAKCGATKVVAVDNDPEAVSNAKENSQLNQVEIECIEGTVQDLPSAKYDILLANINRNTLLEIMPEMRRVLRLQGILLLSGILIEDAAQINMSASAQNLMPKQEETRGEWKCQYFELINQINS